MKTYKITYKETLIHEFYVEATDEDDAKVAFEKGLNSGYFDLSHGYIDDADYSLEEDNDEYHHHYVPSAENGDYSPSNPWDAPGMSIKDFI